MGGFRQGFRWQMQSKMGGLGILDLEKFGRALRLWWPWYEWTEPERAWVGLGTPCNDEDMNLFYASINLTTGDGKTTIFLHSPWLGGVKLKRYRPLHHRHLQEEEFHGAQGPWAWLLDIKSNSEDDILVTCIQEFSILWDKIQEVHLIDDPNSITWKLSNSGVYSSSSAYLAQFETPPTSFMVSAVCANWAPPKCKSFAWLILKNQVWTTDRLIHRGW
jgi:hypothetical protein